jgi:hypothetical protein
MKNAYYMTFFLIGLMALSLYVIKKESTPVRPTIRIEPEADVSAEKELLSRALKDPESLVNDMITEIDSERSEIVSLVKRGHDDDFSLHHVRGEEADALVIERHSRPFQLAELSGQVDVGGLDGADFIDPASIQNITTMQNLRNPPTRSLSKETPGSDN